MAIRLVPTARLFFPCEEATLDLETSAWHLVRPLHTAHPLPRGQFPFQVDELWVYAQLTDGVGKFNLSVQVIDFVTGTVLVTSRPEQREFIAGEQWRVFDEVFLLVNLMLPRAGLYEFRLLANHAPVSGGSSYLRIVEG
jgi:hypothetical protein